LDDEPRDKRPLEPPGLGQVLQFPRAGGLRAPVSGDASGAGVGEASGAELFALLWLALSDMLGTAAAATLLRRSAQRAATTFPELAALEIQRVSLEYQYKVPAAWNHAATKPPEALFLLISELWTLLTELTGSVVANHLLQVPELRQHGLVPPRGSRS